MALPRTWVALGGLGLLIVTAAVWAAVARVPTTVKGPGYLLHQGGIHSAAAPTAGVVVDILHRVGDTVVAGEVLGHVRAADGQLVAARSPSSGKVIEVSVGLGDYLDAGRPLALVDPAAQPEVVYAYLPQSDAKEAHVGDRVADFHVHRPAVAIRLPARSRRGDLPIPRDAGTADVDRAPKDRPRQDQRARPGLRADRAARSRPADTEQA